MKISLNIYLRHLQNINVLQKGWNYISITFKTASQVKLVNQEEIPLDNIDKRDPSRFFDQSQKYDFNEQTKTLTFPALRIEYFDQIIQINKLFQFLIDTSENRLYIEQSIRFCHFKGNIPVDAPPIAGCKFKFTKVISLNNFKVPCIAPFVQSFSEIHFAKLEQVFVWCGVNSTENKENFLLAKQEEIFTLLYHDTFDNTLESLKHSKNLKKIIMQATEFNINQQTKLTYPTNQLAKKSIKQIVNLAAIDSYKQNGNPFIFQFENTDLLFKQETDINRAKAQLGQSIIQIFNDSKRLKEQIFSDVKQNFTVDDSKQSNTQKSITSASIQNTLEQNIIQQNDDLSVNSLDNDDMQNEKTDDLMETDMLTTDQNTFVKDQVLTTSNLEFVNQLIKGESIENHNKDNMEIKLQNQISKDNLNQIIEKQEIDLPEMLLQVCMEIRTNAQCITHINYIKKNTENEVRPLVFLKYEDNMQNIVYDNELSAANNSTRRYTKQQLQYLQNQLGATQIQHQIFKDYKQIMRQHFPQDNHKVNRLFVFVHGFKGSQYDFRYIKDFLQIKINYMFQRSKNNFMCLDYSGINDTQILELGLKMLNQLRRLIINMYNNQTYEDCLSNIDEIHFIGFSMGNIIIESMLSQIQINETELDQVNKFNIQYNQLLLQNKIKDCVELLQQNQKIIKYNQLLYKLKNLFTINGPILSTIRTNGMVQIGMGFLKTFGKGNSNICISELEGINTSRDALQKYVHQIPYLNKLLQFDASDEYTETRYCTKQLQRKLGKNSFTKLPVLDILAFHSKLCYFDEVILFGSFRDGYVNFESALAHRKHAFQGFLLQKFRNVQVHKYIICNDDLKFAENKPIDRQTGRMVHICPLLDTETIDSITNLIYNHAFTQYK